jgi:DNA-directed RNA polymerase III subunit RPC8
VFLVIALLVASKTERFYISTGDVIRFRVESLEWQEVEPLPPSVRNKPPPLDAEGNPIEPTPEEVEMKERLRESEAGLRVMVSWSLGRTFVFVS